MCFSAEADLVAAVAVGAVGVDALRHVRDRAELPLASLPMLLAAHQAVEALVWLGLEDRVGHGIERVAVYLYLFIAFTVLPTLVPVAISALEPAPRRARLWWFTSVGVFVSVVLTWAVVRGPVTAEIDGHHISYAVDLWSGVGVVALYVLATCGPMVASSHRPIRWFGYGNLVAVAALAWLSRSGFISLWCLWAAVTSVAIALHLRHADRSSDPTAVVPAAG